MDLEGSLELEFVDGLQLDAELREALRPGQVVHDRGGRARRLPRYFYEVPSWQAARDLQLTPNFALWEFLNVDVRETERMRRFPRYVPCAVALLATHLEVFRSEVGSFVHVAANGGYRSPAHSLSEHASTHCWGTAVNIYRIGDDMLDQRESIEKYADLARRLLPGVWTRPFGPGTGETDDHLHLDLGFVTVVPHGAPGEDEDPLAAGDAGQEEAA